MSIYELAPEFSHCFVYQNSLWFAKSTAVSELEEIGIKVFRRKNH